MPSPLSKSNQLFPLAAGIIVFAGSGFSFGPPRATEAEEALAKGLAVWRESGRIQNGAACATCHSPDGIEIAAYNFDDATLLRRAKPHLNLADCQTLINYVHALRAKFNFTKLRDPIADRPLQPGGAPLEGNTPEDRDFAFGVHLQSLLPNLFGSPISNVESAQKAESEILKLDPNLLRIGIPLNRVSEDIANGKDHASLAQWLPEVAPIVPAQSLGEWYAAEDAYLKNPTQSELHKLLVTHASLVKGDRMVAMGALSVLKFRALLIWQDRIRNLTEGKTPSLAPEVEAYGGYNPIWEVGDFARQVQGRTPKELGMDDETQSKKLAGPSLEKQLSALRLSWFWAGWLADQGQFKTSRDIKTRLGMWLSQSLSEDGPYPIHSMYANTRRQAVITNEPNSWAETLDRRRRIWDYAGLRSFQYYQNDLPKQPEHKALYCKFACNCFRMNLLLLKAEIERTQTVWVKISTKANVTELASFVRLHEPETSQSIDQLQAEIFSAIEKAKERR